MPARTLWRAIEQRAPPDVDGVGDAVDAVDGDHRVGGLRGDRRPGRAHRDPESASASAGASLTPSPTIITGRSAGSPRRLRTTSSLSSGTARRRRGPRRARAPIRSATERRSPETIATCRTPSSRRRATIPSRVAAQLVGHHDHARRRARRSRPAPAPRRSRARRAAAAAAISLSGDPGAPARTRGCRRRRAGPPTVPAIPSPGSSRTSLRAPRAPGPPRSAAAHERLAQHVRREPVDRRRQAQQLRRARTRPRGAISRISRRADGERAGLVEQHRADLRRASRSRRAPFTITPARAARETPGDERDRRREDQRARRRHDDDRERPTGSPLTAHARRASSSVAGQEEAGVAVRHAHERRALGLRLLDEAHERRVGALGRRPVRPDLERRRRRSRCRSAPPSPP